jgi:hypothetical protein
MQNLIEAFFINNDLAGSDNNALTALVQQIGYSDLGEFFNDNSGCGEVVINWIAKQRVDAWKEALTIPLRSDIQDLLDNGFIELDYDNRYIAVSTNQVILIENNEGARFLVGSIEVNGDNAIFFDEADNKIKGIEHQEAYGIKFK